MGKILQEAIVKVNSLDEKDYIFTKVMVQAFNELCDKINDVR